MEGDLKHSSRYDWPGQKKYACFEQRNKVHSTHGIQGGREDISQGVSRDSDRGNEMKKSVEFWAHYHQYQPVLGNDLYRGQWMTKDPCLSDGNACK